MATKKSAKKASAKKKPSATTPSKRWSAKVTSDSTHPGPGLFKKSAQAIADGLVKKSVSPKGPGQAMQMLSFYENRGGKNLPVERKRTLEHAKDIIRAKEGKPAAAKKTAGKKAAKKSVTKKSTASKSAKNV